MTSPLVPLASNDLLCRDGGRALKKRRYRQTNTLRVTATNEVSHTIQQLSPHRKLNTRVIVAGRVIHNLSRNCDARITDVHTRARVNARACNEF
jgi:hypothetical protein